MSKNIMNENKSTELFFDLACRSFEASWKVFNEINGEGDSYEFLDDPDFMSPFMINIINHIQRNFEKFTVQEGDCGDINEVNFEQIAAMLVEYSGSFRK